MVKFVKQDDYGDVKIGVDENLAAIEQEANIIYIIKNNIPAVCEALLTGNMPTSRWWQNDAERQNDETVCPPEDQWTRLKPERPVGDGENDLYESPEFEFEYRGSKHKVIDTGDEYKFYKWIVTCDRWAECTDDDIDKDLIRPILPFMSYRLSYHKVEEWRKA